jgi:MoaA/NifB/PqqE/SkfB family radical SAM enzyme
MKDPNYFLATCYASGQKEVCVISLTERCNSNCSYCIVQNVDRSDIDVNVAKVVIDNATPGTVITFGGGEPTMNDDLYELVDYAIDRKHDFSLITNGVLLAGRAGDFVFERKDYVRYVTMSYPSSDEATYEEITRSKNYAAANEAIRRLSEIGRKLNVKVVTVKQNVSTIFDTVKFAKTLAPECLFKISMFRTIYERPDLNREYMPSYSSMKKELLRVLDEYADDTSLIDFPLCTIPSVPGVLRCYGNGKYMGRGMQYVMANENTVYKAFDLNASQTRGNTKTRLCKRCRYDGICVGVDEYYPSEHDDLFPVLPIDQEAAKFSSGFFYLADQHRRTVRPFDPIEELKSYSETLTKSSSYFSSVVPCKYEHFLERTRDTGFVPREGTPDTKELARFVEFKTGTKIEVDKFVADKRLVDDVLDAFERLDGKDTLFTFATSEVKTS